MGWAKVFTANCSNSMGNYYCSKMKGLDRNINLMIKNKNLQLL